MVAFSLSPYSRRDSPIWRDRIDVNLEEKESASEQQLKYQSLIAHKEGQSMRVLLSYELSCFFLFLWFFFFFFSFFDV